jgi:hypothetical protein
MAHRQFDFYGVGVRVESTEEEFLSAVEHDFSYFLGTTDRNDRSPLSKPHHDQV